MTKTERVSRTTTAAKQWKEFRAIFVASFVVLLIVAFVAQAFKLNWRPWFPGSEGDRSMIGGVKAAVSNFMPHLQ